LKEYNEKCQKKEKLPNSLEEAGISVINMNGIYFKHFMQLFCDIYGIDHHGKLPVRCAGITDKDPSGKISDVLSSDSIKGKNPVLERVDDINGSKWARLYCGRFKTFEFDLALEGDNRKHMLEVLMQLWPSEGSVKKEIALLLKTSEQADPTRKARIASILLKRVEDTRVGKGYFAQALARHLSESNIAFSVPEYIGKAVIWACGGNPDATP
jgi:predicted ATP-dependent endonuclease of OLD family